MTSNTDQHPIKYYAKWIVGGLTTFALVFIILLGCYAGFKAVGRQQKLADARNHVKVSTIEIQNQAQRIQVTKQKAEIRRQEAIGIREAQEEIAKTLTPLYVQFEMVDALKDIATSGSNNSIVYIPAGANGIPLVSTIDPEHVGQPDGE